MRYTLPYLFLLLSTISLFAQSQSGIPDWFLDDMEKRIGTWIADNSMYKSEQESFDQYQITWNWGIGEKSITGQLFGIEKGKRSPAIWEFKQFWDAETRKATVLQFGGNGIVGKGVLEQAGKDSTELLQSFYTENGEAFLIGHRGKLYPEKEINASYTISKDGVWTKDREYVWERETTKGSEASQESMNPKYDAELATKLGADDYGMKKFVFVMLKTGANKSADKTLRDSCFAGHMRNINRLVEENKLIVAGPMMKNDNAYRGIFILDVDSLEEANDLLQTDPAINANFLKPELYTWYGSAALSEYLEASDKVWKISP